MKKMKVSIIIPNWNGYDLLKKHLQKIIAAAGDCEVIVADDASTDESVEFLRSKFPNVKIIKRQQHQGFVSVVNSGVAQAQGEIVVLLNTDIVPEKGFLDPLISHFNDPKVFAVGCLDKSHEDGKVILRGRGEAGFRKGMYIHRRGEVDKQDTAWVSGGSGAFRKVIWIKLGGMDELFNPFYWEDIDISYRALKAGFTALFEPKSVVHHYHEEGKIRTDYSNDYVKKISYRNQFIFVWKNLTDYKLWLEHLLWLPVHLVRSLLKGDSLMLRGFIEACILMPSIIKLRQVYSPLWRKSDLEIVPHKNFI